MSLDRMSRRSLLGGGTLLTIEKAIGAASAAQLIDPKEATVPRESLIVPWKLQVSDEALADLQVELARAARGAPGLHGVASFVRSDLTAEPPAHCRLVSGHDPFGTVTYSIVSSTMPRPRFEDGERAL